MNFPEKSTQWFRNQDSWSRFSPGHRTYSTPPWVDGTVIVCRVARATMRKRVGTRAFLTAEAVEWFICCFSWIWWIKNLVPCISPPTSWDLWTFIPLIIWWSRVIGSKSRVCTFPSRTHRVNAFRSVIAMHFLLVILVDGCQKVAWLVFISGSHQCPGAM